MCAHVQESHGSNGDYIMEQIDVTYPFTRRYPQGVLSHYKSHPLSDLSNVVEVTLILTLARDGAGELK